MRSRDDLTAAQAEALYCLLQAKKWGVLVPKGKRTAYEDHWNMKIHPIAARHLVKLGWARERCVLIDGREVVGANLVHYLGHWKTKFEVTRRGEQAWWRFDARQRWGLPQRFAAKIEG